MNTDKKTKSKGPKKTSKPKEEKKEPVDAPSVKVEVEKPKPAEVTKPAEPVKPTPAPQKSKPKAQSQVASKLQNDPLWEDFGSDDFDVLMPERGDNRFAVTLEGYIPLIEQTYETLSHEDKTFGKSMSLSMFSWYCCQHLYMRIITIRMSEGLATSDEKRYVAEVSSIPFVIPLTIEIYLKSIGNVMDAELNKLKISFPAFPNAEGHFGVVNNNSHWKYESVPAPYVTSRRMIHDYAYTTGLENDRIWTLPLNLLPPNRDATRHRICGNPTKNLLGWARSSMLTSEQTLILESCGIDGANFPTERPMFQFNRGLFVLLSSHLSAASRSMKMSGSAITSIEGSFGQTLFVERDDRHPEEFDRNVQYCEMGNLCTVSAFQVDKRFSQGAAVCNFRSRKFEINNLRSYACFDFGDYEHVPDGWNNTVNTIFDFGAQADWNRPKFTSAYGSKVALRQSWVKKSLVRDKT